MNKLKHINVDINVIVRQLGLRLDKYEAFASERTFWNEPSLVKTMNRDQMCAKRAGSVAK
ncbi:hypothetical protein [Paenibacillus ginsengihumi]|jgi:hypothetical protein|uniref:hypothetical protein n=1 Tax=Paenibacillus ginsengihumi TaxID=431596 RepID=UPI00035F1624|nr:hypothetical protein [Paenibacillus ginsengihumi]